MKAYHLFMFENGDEVRVLTRGEDMEQALEHASQSPNFRIGSTVSHCGFVPVNAARLYDSNHSPGWLHRPPEWVMRKQRAELARRVRVEGFEAVSSELMKSVVEALRSKSQEAS